MKEVPTQYDDEWVCPCSVTMDYMYINNNEHIYWCPECGSLLILYYDEIMNFDRPEIAKKND